MANPNGIHSKERKTYNLVFEVSKNTELEANTFANECKEIGIYDMVKVSRFKVGAKPNANNNYKQAYLFIVRCYNKQSSLYPL